MDAQSQPIMGYTLMATRAGQPPIWVFILTAGRFMKDRGSPILDARSHPIMRYTLMAARAEQLPIWIFTLTVTLWGPS